MLIVGVLLTAIGIFVYLRKTNKRIQDIRLPSRNWPHAVDVIHLTRTKKTHVVTHLSFFKRYFVILEPNVVYLYSETSVLFEYVWTVYMWFIFVQNIFLVWWYSICITRIKTFSYPQTCVDRIFFCQYYNVQENMWKKGKQIINIRVHASSQEIIFLNDIWLYINTRYHWESVIIKK